MTHERPSVPRDPEAFRALAARVAAALESGLVVALPTETVYGLCARANQPEAIRSIYSRKGRPENKPLPYLIPDADAALSFVNDVPKRARKIAARWWPGPLTLVLGYPHGTAMRVPDHLFTQEVLRRTLGPVQATSANRSGGRPGVSAAEVAATFPDLPWIVDGGTCAVGRESTIVRASEPHRLSILRAGALSEEDLLDAAPLEILLVCTGNTCRSPMAEAILIKLLAEALRVDAASLSRRGFVIRSAGIAASRGSPMTEEAREVLLEKGQLQAPLHRSTRVSPEVVESADIIWVMTESHGLALDAAYPSLLSTWTLLDPAGAPILDPIGRPRAEYARTRDTLEACLRQRLPEILRAGRIVGPDTE